MTEEPMAAMMSVAATQVIAAPDPLPQSITWHAFDLKSGRRGPQVTVQSNPPLTRIIGEATDANLSVLCWDEQDQSPVPGWEAATDPGRTLLVALNDAQQPLWGGYVVARNDANDGTSPWVSVSLATLEGYLDRRFTTDQTYNSVDQSTIMAGLVDMAGADGIGFTVDAPASGIPRTRTYLHDEDKTILSAMQELMEVDGGPDFTIDLEWADSTQTVLDKVVRVRRRLGTASDLPVAVFEMPGSVTSYTFTEDYGSEHGANHVIAVSSGEGDTRPESLPQVASDLIAGGWARFDHRFTPSTSIINQAVLIGHAAAKLGLTKAGLTELVLEARLDAAPQFGSDFHLGDDVRAVLTSPRFPARIGSDGGLSAGYSAVMRCVGVEIDVDNQRIKPRLWGDL